MAADFNISQIRNFINKEKLYILMLGFILLVNAWLIFAQKVPGMKEGFVGRKVFGLHWDRGPEEVIDFESGKYGKTGWYEVLEKERRIPFFVNILGFAGLCVFAFGLFLDIRILMAKIKKTEIIPGPGTHSPTNWTVLDIFKLAIIFVFLGYILHILETGLLSYLPQDKNRLGVTRLLNTGIMDLVLLAFVIYFVKAKYGHGLAAIGLKLKGALKSILWAILSYIAFLPILAFILLVVIILACVINYQPQQQALFKLFLEEKSLWLLIYSTAMVAIIGPIIEEVFFRGFSYNAIKRKWGASRAMLLTAVVFAGLHANLIGFLPIMALGLLLAYTYEKTGSLICPIAIHILHNSLVVSLLFLGRYFMQLVASG